MLKDRADGAAVAVSANFHRAGQSEVEYTYFDDAIYDDDVRNALFAEQAFGADDPKIRELIELSGALEIAHAAWICRIGEDGMLAELLARCGLVSMDEIADVLESLRGPINFSHASRPFRWLAGGREYIVCAIGGGTGDHLGLFLRADGLQAGNWARIEAAAARVQRLVSLSVSINAKAPERPVARIEQDGSVSAGAIADLCPFGILVVDINQEILLANDAMKAFFADTALIGNLGGKLAIFNSDDAVRLHVALRSVLTGTGKEQQHTIALTDGDTRPVLLSISRVADDGGPARACVMVTDSAADYKVHIQPLAEAFALTPVETRLVAQLAQGRSVQEAAARLKLKVETVRTYLKQIFQKTGTHRQLELVQLMKGGALPMLA